MEVMPPGAIQRFAVEPREAMQDLFVEFLDQIGADHYGHDCLNRSDVEQLENDTFVVRPYWWGDCTCGADDADDEREHAPDCALERANFEYKPLGLTLSWYKYPMRSATCTHDLTPHDFAEILMQCTLAVPGRRAASAY